MKKALLVLLIAVIAVTSVFAYSDFTAKIGYDQMAFATTKGNHKVNGLSFGVRGDVDLYKGICATASVDGIVPFATKDGNDNWERITERKGFGLKTKLGASYEMDFGPVDLSLGVNGIYEGLFLNDQTNGKGYLMNGGMGADVCVDFNITPNFLLGVEFEPELMFGNTWSTLDTNSGRTVTSGTQFAYSSQIAATIIF